MILEMEVFPDPPMVSPNPLPVIVPALLMVRLPESELICEAAPSVISPAKVLSPEMFRKAPAALIPVPLRFRASAPIEIPPESSNAAPLATVVPAAVVPREVAFEARRAPALMVVAPA